MKIKELIERLSKEDPERTVILSNWEEYCQRELYDIRLCNWNGKSVGRERLTESDIERGLTEEDLDKGEPAIVLVQEYK